MNRQSSHVGAWVGGGGGGDEGGAVNELLPRVYLFVFPQFFYSASR